MRMLFCGDLSPTVVTNPLFKKHDVEALFQDATSIFEHNDVNFVNLECVLTESEEKIVKIGPPLKACSEVAEVLKEVGVHYCGVSNNHFFDYGIRGVKDTLAKLDEVGIQYTGYGKDEQDARNNLVIEKNGESICVIAVCEHEYSYALSDREGCRAYDDYDTLEDIRTAKANCDRVIVIYHGGKELCRYPSPRLRHACRSMVRSGADVVLCQHSHCIGCYENYEEGHILYGQGNFHFVKKEFSSDGMEDLWNNGLAVRYDTRKNEIEFTPLAVYGNGIGIAKGAVCEHIMSSFEQRNKELHTGVWKEKWHEFCISVKGQYEKVVNDAGQEDSTYKQNHMFAHYLDCEAHLDVWKELYQTSNMTNEK